MTRALATVLATLALASCAVASGERFNADADASVQQLAVDFGDQGRGTVHFTLQVPGREVGSAYATEVQWQLWLDGRPFASGLTAVKALVPPQKPSLVEVTQGLRYGFRGGQSGRSLVDARLEGTVTRSSVGAEERLRFDRRVRLEVGGAQAQ